MTEKNDTEPINIQDIKTQLEQLEKSKCEDAMAEIQAILNKYGVQISGYAIVPMSHFQIVPKRT